LPSAFINFNLPAGNLSPTLMVITSTPLHKIENTCGEIVTEVMSDE
jgi:hypothetical protein